MTNSPQKLTVATKVVDAAQRLVYDLATCLEQDPNASAETQDQTVAASLEWLDLLSCERNDPQVIAVTAYLIAAAPEHEP